MKWILEIYIREHRFPLYFCRLSHCSGYTNRLILNRKEIVKNANPCIAKITNSTIIIINLLKSRKMGSKGVVFLPVGKS